jgi:chromatin segregation and condensation protein Rec8/ScpA/Scc1 (kleisin family)
MNKIIVLLVFTFVWSCQNEPTLQKYFVEKTESIDFLTVDVSPNILNIQPDALTIEQQNALKTFKKMNVLAFKIHDQNKSKFDDELTKVKEILKDEKYQQLMKFGSGKDGAAVYFVGENDAIEEFVLYGSQAENGFAVVRILGDKMNPENFMTLLEALKKSDIDMEQLKPLEGILK